MTYVTPASVTCLLRDPSTAAGARQEREVPDPARIGWSSQRTSLSVGPGDHYNANHAEQRHNLRWPRLPVGPIDIRNRPNRRALSDTSYVDRVLRRPSGCLGLRRPVPQRWIGSLDG